MNDAMIEHQLKMAFYRLDCPETAELGEYHLDFLNAARRMEIAQHLQACPHCTGELAQLGHFLAELAPELRQGMYNPLKVWVARLVSQTQTGTGNGMQPAFAVRGGDQAPRVYEAGDAQVVLEVQDEPAATKTLVGLILGVDPADLTVYLWRSDDPVKSAAVDELGNFILANIKPGNYQLIVTNSELGIRVPSVEV